MAEAFQENGLSRVCRPSLKKYLKQAPDLVSLAKILNHEMLLIDSCPVVVGYSMGGRILLHQLLEAECPIRVAVIVSADVGLASFSERQCRLESDDQWARKLKTLNQHDFMQEWNSQPVFADSSAFVKMSELKGSRQSDTGDAEWEPELQIQMLRQWGLGRQEPLLSRIHQIQVPTVWVVGEKDSKFCHLARLAREQNDKIFLNIVPDVGHRIPLLKPQELLQTLNKSSSFLF